MKRRVNYLLLGITLALSSSAFAAQPPAAPVFFPATAAFDRLIDHVVAREAANIKALRTYSPLVETYVQEMRANNELGLVPVDDRYYLTRIVFKKTLDEQNFRPKPGFACSYCSFQDYCPAMGGDLGRLPATVLAARP